MHCNKGLAFSGQNNLMYKKLRAQKVAKVAKIYSQLKQKNILASTNCYEK